jgi:hypothetical protein
VANSRGDRYTPAHWANGPGAGSLSGLALGADGSLIRPPLLVDRSKRSNWTGSEGVVDEALAAASACLGSPSLLFERPVTLVLKDMPILFPAKRIREGVSSADCLES